MDKLFDYLEGRLSDLKNKLDYYQGKDNRDMLNYLEGLISAYQDIYNDILAGKYRNLEG